MASPFSFSEDSKFRADFKDFVPMTTYLIQLHLGFLTYTMGIDNFYAIKLLSEGEGSSRVLCIPKDSMSAMHVNH